MNTIISGTQVFTIDIQEDRPTANDSLLNNSVKGLENNFFTMGSLSWSPKRVVLAALGVAGIVSAGYIWWVGFGSDRAHSGIKSAHYNMALDALKRFNNVAPKVNSENTVN